MSDVPRNTPLPLEKYALLENMKDEARRKLSDLYDQFKDAVKRTETGDDTAKGDLEVLLNDIRGHKFYRFGQIQRLVDIEYQYALLMFHVKNAESDKKDTMRRAHEFLIYSKMVLNFEGTRESYQRMKDRTEVMRTVVGSNNSALQRIIGYAKEVMSK